MDRQRKIRVRGKPVTPTEEQSWLEIVDLLCSKIEEISTAYYELLQTHTDLKDRMYGEGYGGLAGEQMEVFVAGRGTLRTTDRSERVMLDTDTQEIVTMPEWLARRRMRRERHRQERELTQSDQEARPARRQAQSREEQRRADLQARVAQMRRTPPSEPESAPESPGGRDGKEEMM